MSIWQTKQWQKMLKRSEQVSVFFELNNIFIEKRQVALGEYGLFVLGLEKQLSEKDVKQLIQLCEKENCLFIQVETISYETLHKSILSKEGSSFIGKFNKGYYKKFITPYTSVINLEETEDEILAKMKPKGRYNIKVAIKKGVEVTKVEKTDENIKKYYDLMLETTSRDNFNGNSVEYYKTFLNNLKSAELILAYSGKKVIAGGIFVFDKNISIYYYGASTSDKEYRNMMAPYLLQWEAIKIAKDTGTQLFDFLGVAGPNEKKSELAGVTDFKLKLSKDVREVSNSFIYINKGFKYFIIKCLRKIKRK